MTALEIDAAAEIAIVGAGLAGTALALACQQAGLNVRLYEQRNQRSSARTLLELTANGSRVLHALGLKDPLARAASTPAFTTIRSASSGFLLSQRPLGAFSEARYGAPSYLIEAGALEALLWQACEQADIPLERACRISQVRTDSATLVLADGSERQHLAAAVATGAPARPGELADLLEQRQWQADERVTVIRARSNRSEPSRDHDRFINHWLLRGAYCIERPIPETGAGIQSVELTAVVAAPQPESSAVEALCKLLADAHPHLSSLTQSRASVEAEYLRLPATQVSEYWQAGRCALLGAACHSPAAYSDLTPAAVLEDAWILSRMMERWEEEPHQHFDEYERYRKSRARRLARFAADQLQIQTLDQPRAIWQRNFSWSLTSRFLPEIAMQKLDWLYGYDCIKGFV